MLPLPGSRCTVAWPRAFWNLPVPPVTASRKGLDAWIPAASFKRSGCPLDFVRFKVSGFSDDVLMNVKVASVDASRDFAQHWVIACDPHLVETFHHGVIVAGAVAEGRIPYPSA